MERKNLRLERSEQRKMDNKLFILKTAERIIAHRGYSLTSMDEIAEEAQFSKATLYRYFASKGKLFYEIIVHSIEELNHKLREVQKEDTTADEKLKNVVKVFFSHLTEKENITRIFFMDKFLMKKLQIFATGDENSVSLVEKKFISTIKKMKKETLSIMNEIIDSGVKRGEFRSLESEDTAVMLESFLYGFFYGRHWQEKKYTLEKGIDLIYNHLLRGMKRREEDKEN